MKSAHVRQAILTSLKAHQTDTHEQQFTSPMQAMPPTPSTTPPPKPMQCDKVSTYVVPAQRNQKLETEKQCERCQGLCHKCGGKRHIKRCCPKSLMRGLKPITHVRAAPSIPLVKDQGWRQPREPEMTPQSVVDWLLKQTPENRDKLMVALVHQPNRRDFYLAQARWPLHGLYRAVRFFQSLML
jgi:hypothetical protein